MSVIQKIRDKYARVAVVAIAFALLGFILMDALGSRGGGLFGGNDNTLGKINGKKIEYETFSRRVSEIEQRQGSNMQIQQIVNGLWEQELNDVIMGEQYEALGLTVTDKEIDQMLYVPNPSPMVQQIFGLQGGWDPNLARQEISRMKKSGTVQEKANIEESLGALRRQILLNKYQALLGNSVYVPKWFLEKRNVDASQMAKASYVAVPYTTIPDSTVKVTDEEIMRYVKANRTQYEVKEETRSISYVTFSAAPSSADTAVVRDQMVALRDSFTATTNVKDFLIANRSDFQYNEGWIAQKDVEQQIQNADSIFKAPVGVAVGPLVDQRLGRMIMSKLVEKSTQPDTVKVRHILIATATRDPQTGQMIPMRDSVTAKKLADSVKSVIDNGAIFDSVAAKVSDDPGSKFRGGVYDSITRQTGFVPEFKEFAFTKPVGSRDLVKTEFGYHLIEVLNQRGSSPVYKLALFGLPIDVSEDTESQASNDAASLVGNARDEKSFNEYFEKNLKGKGYNKMTAPNLHPMDYNITGINGAARELVKAAFDAEKGDVLNAVKIGSDYVVAIVTDVVEPGLPSATSVRPLVEAVLMNKKKGEQIKKQMGTVTDLNAVAAKFNLQVQSADSIRFSGSPVLGYEPKVLGALFFPANKGKVVAEGITGNVGVYAVRVENTFTGAVENANIEEQRKMMEMQARQQGGQPLEILKKRAEIKDNRAKFY